MHHWKSDRTHISNIIQVAQLLHNFLLNFIETPYIGVPFIWHFRLFSFN